MPFSLRTHPAPERPAGSVVRGERREPAIMFFLKAAPRMYAHPALALLFVALSASAQDIIVSPAGPIKTLAEARDQARAERRSGATGPITITVRGGTYFLPET